MRRLTVCALVLSGVVSGSAQQIVGTRVAPQTEKCATITGVVTDLWGAVIPWVTVTATNRKGKKIQTTANDEGLYRFELLSGRYKLVFKHKPKGGYISTTIVDYQVPYEGTVHLDMSLRCCKGPYVTVY